MTPNDRIELINDRYIMKKNVSDMLQALCMVPAMYIYIDNRKRQKGLIMDNGNGKSWIPYT